MNVQHLDMTAGEDRTFAMAARGPTNAPYNLTGNTVSWRIGCGPGVSPSKSSLFTKTGTVVSAVAGTFTAAVMPSDTKGLRPGEYRHEAWATVDATGVTSLVCAGRLIIRLGLET